MIVQHEGDDKKARFYIEDEHSNRIALMEYVYAGTDKFIIEHTEVDSRYEGKGLGKLLVEASVHFAREKGLKVIPLCPYAKRVFDKTEEYSDVLFHR